MKAVRRKTEQAVQLSLWDKFEDMTDSEILSVIAKKEIMLEDDLYGNYRMQRIFNSLTPQVRKVAESVIELYRRRDVTKHRRQKLATSKAAYQVFAPKMADLNHEEFWIVGLNNAGNMIAVKKISTGGVDMCSADVRIIFQELLSMNATGFIAAHNHPSGNLCPSGEDKRLTKKLKEAGNVMSIRMLDHLIITSGGYYSFNDEGDL